MNSIFNSAPNNNQESSTAKDPHGELMELQAERVRLERLLTTEQDPTTKEQINAKLARVQAEYENLLAKTRATTVTESSEDVWAGRDTERRSF